MIGLPLPPTQAGNAAPFTDAESAGDWLMRQPQANAPAMQAELAQQIARLNAYAMPARERFKTLEVLRKTLFAVAAECQRRFETRPLPLAGGEQAMLDTARDLWRACTVGYLHCLRAVLDGDPTLAGQGARVAHRVLSGLRMEQASCHAGGVEPDAEFWRTLHAVLAAAEHLDCTRLPVADRLLGETAESTVGGQYAMALLLHLARPFALSRGQLSAATRWFARWREQAAVLAAPDDPRPGRCVALDLALDAPTHRGPGGAAEPRWLALSGVLRKMRKRLEALAAGATPESLKLGSGLSAEACTGLLKTLAEHLKQPEAPLASAGADAPAATLVGGLDHIYRQLGGKSLKALDDAGLLRDRRAHEQIALFGHVVRTEEEEPVPAEIWRIAESEGRILHLCRPPGGGEARLAQRALIGLRLPGQARYALARIASLRMDGKGTLHAFAQQLPGAAQTVIAEVRERVGGRNERHPAFLLPALDAVGSPAQVLLAAGLPARAQTISLLAEDGAALRLDYCAERGSDYERWVCRPA